MAFTPSTPGIRKSIRVTSGRCFFQSSAACCPSPVSATTSISASCLMIATNPSRTTVWSSATRTRITFDLRPSKAPSTGSELETNVVSPDRIFSRMLASVRSCFKVPENDLNFSALTRHGTQDELTTHLVHSFFHSNQPKAFVFRVQIKSNAIVHETKLDFIRTNGQRGSEVSRSGMFDRICQRFLGHAQQARFPLCRHHWLITFQMK